MKPIGIIKKAILINNPSDLKFLESEFSDEHTLIARNYNTSCKTGCKTESYFRNISNYAYAKNYDVVIHMVLNWFRDDYGNDLSFNKGISIGNIIARRLLSAFANDFRNYYTMKYLLEKYDTINISLFDSPSIKRVAETFGNKIQWYKPRNNNTENFSADPERTLFYNFPEIHPLSKIAKIIQKPFLKYVKNRKYLCIQDWTNINQFNNRNDTLMLNSLIPWKGYYFNLSSEVFNEADKIFPKVIDSELLNMNRLKNVASRIEAKLDSELITHFSSLVTKEYSNGREMFKRTYALYREVFSFYNPDLVFIPGETHFGYVIAAQLANEMGIKSCLVLDGYQFVLDDSLFYKNQDNKKFIFDKFIAFGEAHDEILKLMDVKKNDISICSPTIINHNIKISNSNRKYDVIIMDYNPSQINPNSRCDKRGKFVVDLILLLHNLGFNKLALKIKDFPASGDYYKEILDLWSYK